MWQSRLKWQAKHIVTSFCRWFVLICQMHIHLWLLQPRKQSCKIKPFWLVVRFWSICPLKRSMRSVLLNSPSKGRQQGLFEEWGNWTSSFLAWCKIKTCEKLGLYWVLVLKLGPHRIYQVLILVRRAGQGNLQKQLKSRQQRTQLSRRLRSQKQRVNCQWFENS